MFEKILVPLDGSLQSQAALVPARWLATQSGAALRVVQALRKTPDGNSAEAYTRARIRCEKYLGRVVAELRLSGFQADWQLLEIHEEVVDDLLWAISHWKADLVVMTSHCRQGLTRILRASVAGRLLRKATCPILVVGKNSVNFRSLMGVPQ